jgi:hypothetical protein
MLRRDVRLKANRQEPVKKGVPDFARDSGISGRFRQ